MIKVLDTDQLRKLDQQTILHEPIASIDLMERAASAFVQWFVHQFNAAHKVGIICGPGSNGGDGLAIARLLKNWNYPVKVWTVAATKQNEDFVANKARLNHKIEISEITGPIEPTLFADRHILIDGLFGIGISRQAEGIFANIIDTINNTTAIKIAIDVPSGLFLEAHSYGHVVRAHHTVTFQLPKLAFFFPENFRFVGHWHVLDIGLNKAYLKEAKTTMF